MPTYCIGENDPFRVTKDSGQKLLLAIASTGAAVIAMTLDSSCPPGHICARFAMTEEQAKLFERQSGISLEIAESAGGQ